MHVLTMETTSLGDRSYLVHDGQVAAVIDPQRDIDRVLALLDEHGLRLAGIFETHVHNDYVTGGLELARRTGARYHLNADEDLSFDFAPIADGESVTVGSFTVRALLTPGHTPTHLSYAVSDDSRDVAVFTGGSLLYGSVGRTDLIGAAHTEQLTRAQYRSARRLVEEFDDDVAVLPTHGFGSFCSSGDTSGDDTSTIGDERRGNQALTVADEDEFLRVLLAGLDAYPAYYAHMGPANRSGPADVDLSPPARVDTADLARRIHAGEWVVDLRSRTAFARNHLTGTINIEFADPAATYVGWLMPWGTPVTLIADTPDEVADMQRQLVRIGVDRPAGQVPEGIDEHAGLPRGSYAVDDFAGLRRALDDGRDVVVLDARRNLEWVVGHLPMAVHIPLHELPGRLGDVPDGEVWIHCASGYRAAIGASLLARAGRRVVLVDDDFDEHSSSHFEIVPAAAAA